MSGYWDGRGVPWHYDSGPPRNRKWARLFAETPNYRRLGKEALGREKFRWHFGPMFYRGRLRDGRVKVLIVGQEGAQDESLSHRAFTGGTGARMQHFLHYLGIDYSYLFLNTFVYPIYGQYGRDIEDLAQSPTSPIAAHRNEIFDYVLERNDLRLVVAVGNAAKQSVASWVRARGGRCPSGWRNLSTCEAHHLGPRTKAVGVPHPGGAAQGGQLASIVRGFRRAANKIADWVDEDPEWLVPDWRMTRDLDQPFEYGRAPVPFRDLPFAVPMRLGRGGTSSNRKDSQRSIQIFSAGGRYNARGARLRYENEARGDPQGYEDDAGDLPYEPPRHRYRDYDSGPGRRLGQLLVGPWPDFDDLGLSAEPSLGFGAAYRGRVRDPIVLVLGDQQGHDDLFTGRALTGDCGQRLQRLLTAVGITTRYFILRVLPVECLDVSSDVMRDAVRHPDVVGRYQVIVDYVLRQRRPPQFVLALGPHAQRLAAQVVPAELPVVALKPWDRDGDRRYWRRKLAEIRDLDYEREAPEPSFDYEGERSQIPRRDLPYGTPRWVGTSGDRGSQPTDLDTGRPSADYFKLYVPSWVHRLAP